VPGTVLEKVGLEDWRNCNSLIFRWQQVAKKTHSGCDMSALIPNENIKI